MDALGVIRTARARSILLSCLALAACGGGGNSAPPPSSSAPPPSSPSPPPSTPTPATYSLGGSISGLVGTIVLQTSSDTATVSSNGSFRFATPLTAGSTYEVTIRTPPRGQNCVVTNGSGTASADVGNITVACTTDASGFHVAFTFELNDLWGPVAHPDTGLYAVYSKAPTATPVRVTTTPIRELGYVMRPDGIPAALVYYTFGASGGDHIWALDLSATSNLQPRQLTSLTLDEQGLICRPTRILSDTDDPGSAAFIVALPTTEYRCAGEPEGHDYFLVRLSASADQAAQPVPTLHGNVLPLYGASGELTGLLSQDSARNLAYYADVSFTNPRVLRAGVATFGAFYPMEPTPLTPPSATPAATFVTVYNGDQTASLHAIDATGTLSPELYRSLGSTNQGAVYDSQYLYFNDVLQGPTLRQRIVRVSRTGNSNAEVLHDRVAISADEQQAYLRGLAGGRLVMHKQTGRDPVSNDLQTAVSASDVNAPDPLSPFATYTADVTNALPIGDHILIENASVLGTAVASTTEIRDANGNIVQPSNGYQRFVGYGVDSALQISGLEADGTYGANTRINVLRFDAASAPTSIALALEGTSTPFVPPSTEKLDAATFMAPDVAFGWVLTGQSNIYVAVYDLSRNVIGRIDVPSRVSVRFLRYAD
jgi:hypothetical protein